MCQTGQSFQESFGRKNIEHGYNIHAIHNLVAHRVGSSDYSLLCWYCTRSWQKLPEMDAKSVHCD
jgi:hypothetical protein